MIEYWKLRLRRRLHVLHSFADVCHRIRMVTLGMSTSATFGKTKLNQRVCRLSLLLII